MIKKCIGCGLELQDRDEDKQGYTPNMKNQYCMRCFRLKNYGEKKEGEVVNEEAIIRKVNKSRGIVFFLIDYLNLNKYTLDIFKRIKLPKALVVSKSDVLRREMKFKKIETWLRQVYGIEDDVLFISKNNDFKNVNIFKAMDKRGSKTVFIMGITNAGKSTFINSILKKQNIRKEIVVSDKPNTTLDFIKLRVGEYVIYDTPGFDYLNLNYRLVSDEIKPVSLNIVKPTTVIINGAWEFYFDSPNRVIFYLTHNSVKKVFKNTIKNNVPIRVEDNQDIVVPGVGFINVKEAGVVMANMEILEVRNSVTMIS